MDFQGQKLAELWLSRVLIAFAAVGFLAGYLFSDFNLMVYINVAGLAVTLLLVVPDWPFFNKHPLQWLPPLNPEKPQELDKDMGAQLVQALKAGKSRKA